MPLAIRGPNLVLLGRFESNAIINILYFNFFSAETDFRRQILTYKVGLSAEFVVLLLYDMYQTV